MKNQVANYILHELIGCGSYGEVYRATRPDVTASFTVKLLPKATFSPWIIPHLQKEKALCEILEDENVVKLLDFFETESSIGLVFEHCAMGDLMSYRGKRPGLEESVVRDLLEQIVQGVDASYSLKGVPRSIKLSNVLILGEKAGGRLVVKLGDYDYGRLLNSQSDSEQPLFSVGTPYNQPPELFQGDGWSPKSDVWAVGTLAYELVVGRPCFSGGGGLDNNKLGKAMMDGTYKFPKEVSVSEECLDFITSCIQYEPETRLAWTELLKHPFIMLAGKGHEFSAEKFVAENLGLAGPSVDGCLLLNSRAQYSFGYKLGYEVPSATVAKSEESKKDEGEIVDAGISFSQESSEAVVDVKKEVAAECSVFSGKQENCTACDITKRMVALTIDPKDMDEYVLL